MRQNRYRTEKKNRLRITVYGALALLPLFLLFSFTGNINLQKMSIEGIVDRQTHVLPDSVSSAQTESSGDMIVRDAEGSPAEEFASLDLSQIDALDAIDEEYEALSSDAEVLVHTVRPGETLSSIWGHYGGNASGGVAAAAAFKNAGLSVRSLRAGDDLELHVHESGEIVGFKKNLGEGKLLFLEGNTEEGYVHTVVIPELTEVERRAAGTITSSFVASAIEAGVSYAVIDELVDLFSSRLDFNRNLHPGDSFSVIYTENTLPDGEVASTGSIVGASIKTRGKLLAAILHQDEDGQNHWYDESGEPVGNYFLRYPLNFTRISSVFSKSRFHPVTRTNRPHNGTDFAAPTGTPVRSVADGVVIISGMRGGSGNMVRIKHNERYTTEYLHLSRINPGIRNGARVSRGQVIGAVGMTGLATGPHLHFGMFENGRYVDPMKVDLPKLSPDSNKIPVAYLEATLRSLSEQHEIVTMASRTDEEESKAS